MTRSKPTSQAKAASSPTSSTLPDATVEHDLNCLTISELEALAYERMDKQTRDYYNEGADRGSTLRENLTAYTRYRIRPRVLRDISQIDTTTTLFSGPNTKVSVPLGVAPTAMQCLAHEDGEIATARACRSKGVAMGLSSFSTSTLEDVAEANGDNPHVLQLYLFEEREHSRKLIERAKRAGYKAVLLTVDTPMLGRRNLEIRNQFRLPKHLRIANFAEQGEKDVGAAVQQQQQQPKNSSDKNNSSDDKNSGGGSSGESNSSSGSNSHSSRSSANKARTSPNRLRRNPPSGPIRFHTHAPNPTLNWEESIPWLRKVCGSDMEVWVKGIATAEDALLAVHHGVDGIVVSNHGGRQLDGALATLDALPEVVAAVQRKIPVHVDGGIRHGTDVFKALALGADFCWIGRPVLWGLAYKGQQGVELCLRLIMDEFKLCMGLAGVTSVSEITKDYLCRVDRDGFVSKL